MKHPNTKLPQDKNGEFHGWCEYYNPETGNLEWMGRMIHGDEDGYEFCNFVGVEDKPGFYFNI